MNINFILNSENLPFLNQLIKYKETKKSVKETKKSVKETKKVEDYSNITYSFNLGNIDIISNHFLLFEHKIIDYSSYINLLEYMNNNKNSKVIFYYATSNKEKLSQTKKILTFLNENNDFKKIHKLILEIKHLFNLKQLNNNWQIPEHLKSYFDAEDKLNQLFKKKLDEFKRQYFDDKDEIILNDEEEFEGIEFIELPDISNYNKEYIIFFLLKKLSEMYENIPILYINSFENMYFLDELEKEKENDLIFQNPQSPKIFFKNIKNIDEIINFIKKNTDINDILNEFYEEKKEDYLSKYYNYKN
jgi:hypothetical protein